jgi:hypothetical protein
LQQNGKSTTDVCWVWRTDQAKNCLWDEFEAMADFTYNSGFGGNEIHDGLVVVGTDWWMERHVYDGSEWWEFKTLPIRNFIADPLTAGDLK